MGYLLFIITPIFFLVIIFFYNFRNKNGLPTNWPLVGMLPALLENLPRLNDFNIELMERSSLSFALHGPWFTDMHYLVTIDPANVHHILSKNFGNYDKGSKLNEILLETLGDGILNADATLWQYQRNVALSFFNHPKFNQFLVNVTLRKLEHGLIPILDHASKQGIVIDMQDIFLRFMYDTMCNIMMDHDSKCLSVDLPSFPILKAVADLEKGAIYRHIVPTFVWKFLRMLNVGFEKKIKQACSMLDNLIYKCIDRKREQRSKRTSKNEASFDLLTFFMDQDENERAPFRHDNDKFLRDVIINFFLAGVESTSIALSWFFCLVSKNPLVLQKIKEEIQQVMVQVKSNNESISINFSEINNKLIYLHAAICETMRLYPSIVSNPNSPIESDILPSGHLVNKSSEILINLHAMGRSKSIWGDDCNEFKPERWITQDGKIKHEPSYKYSVFGSGPRTCLGKQMALTQIKVVAINIIQNYKLEAVEKYHVPEIAIMLRMKGGFRVKVFRT